MATFIYSILLTFQEKLEKDKKQDPKYQELNEQKTKQIEDYEKKLEDKDKALYLTKVLEAQIRLAEQEILDTKEDIKLKQYELDKKRDLYDEIVIQNEARIKQKVEQAKSEKYEKKIREMEKKKKEVSNLLVFKHYRYILWIPLSYNLVNNCALCIPGPRSQEAKRRPAKPTHRFPP